MKLEKVIAVRTDKPFTETETRQ